MKYKIQQLLASTLMQAAILYCCFVFIDQATCDNLVAILCPISGCLREPFADAGGAIEKRELAKGAVDTSKTMMVS